MRGSTLFATDVTISVAIVGICVSYLSRSRNNAIIASGIAIAIVAMRGYAICATNITPCNTIIPIDVFICTLLIMPRCGNQIFVTRVDVYFGTLIIINRSRIPNIIRCTAIKCIFADILHAFSHSHLIQVYTALEYSMSNTGYAIRDRNRLYSVAAGECITIDERHIVRNDQICNHRSIKLEVAAIRPQWVCSFVGEDDPAPCGQIRNLNGTQKIAAIKRTHAHRSDTVSKCDRFQFGATCKRITANGLHSVADGHIVHTRATMERATVNVLHTVRNGERFQSGTAAECRSANGDYTVRYGNLSESRITIESMGINMFCVAVDLVSSVLCAVEANQEEMGITVTAQISSSLVIVIVKQLGTAPEDIVTNGLQITRECDTP